VSVVWASGAAEFHHRALSEPDVNLSAHPAPSIRLLAWGLLDSRVSRPVGLHHRPLAEPSMRLSPHSAPIR
jgi:hypothetical protein